ncbi:MAG TPA: ribonuclease PH [Candidatus Poseidoniales archaeon]|nr:ribonuclease PH [Euryarchaeota archaeon]DAC12006.1 MAG TPA: ribonuclease PH [Candidatus Poseidoniales archaeon]
MKSGGKEDGRAQKEMREITVDFDFTPNALSSILYKQGETMVLATVTADKGLPRWFPRNATRGWIHAEYSLLPGSTNTRFRRERNGAKGRTHEIERLVARSLRGAVDLEALGPISMTVDCEILNADGGTRCASITAGNIALRLAIRRLIASGRCLPINLRGSEQDLKDGWTPPDLTPKERADHESAVMANDVAALSVGMVDGKVRVDLDYVLDSNADVDMNVVMTSEGSFVEVQGTGEEATYTRDELDSLLNAAVEGIGKLHRLQASLLEDQD